MSGGPQHRLAISVVVPSWQDADNLAVLLPKVCAIEQICETIVVDASGDERTAKIAALARATLIRCPKPNRGAQMNLGAASARGDIVLFQHADTELTSQHLDALEHALGDPEIIGGAFYRKFDDRHRRLVWLEQFARYLTRRGGTLYGDQSMFVRRDVFAALGGFAEIPLMEDVEFTRRLRAAGKIVVLDPPIQTSPRRHARRGAWRTSLQNGLFIVLFKFGVSPHQLHRWYYGVATRSPAFAPSPSELEMWEGP